MDFGTGVIFLVIGILVAVVVRWTAKKWSSVAKVSSDGSLERAKSNISEAEERYQEVLRRELANIIQDISLEAFEKAFYKMQEFEEEMLRAKDTRRKAELQALVQKYEFFSDFDLIGTRHFVRYDREQGVDDFIDRYVDISKFLILNRRNASRRLYNDEEVMVFQRNMKKQKALRLKGFLKEALERLHRHWRSIKDETGNWNTEQYDDLEFHVSRLVLWNTPESAYGIVCKKTGEYGVYTLFVGDDGKSYETYYRSDEGFSEDSCKMI
jgi:hypothetical protein